MNMEKKFMNINLTEKKDVLQRYRTMKQILCVALLLFLCSSLNAREQAYYNSKGDLQKMRETQRVIVESWDKDHSKGGWGWRVYTNEEQQIEADVAASTDGKKYNPKFLGVKVEREVKLLSGAPPQDKDKLKVEDPKLLGVRFRFSFPSLRNTVTIKPPPVDEYRFEVPRQYISHLHLHYLNKKDNPQCYDNPTLSSRYDTNLASSTIYDCIIGVGAPGKIHKIAVWVMSRNYDYELKASIENNKGRSSEVSFGKLNFRGWRLLAADVPGNIIDPHGYLILKNLKVKSTKTTVAGDMVYLFFDELQILTEIHGDNYYEGSELSFDIRDCEAKNKIYSMVKRTSRFPENWVISDCSKLQRQVEDQALPENNRRTRNR